MINYKTFLSFFKKRKGPLVFFVVLFLTGALLLFLNEKNSKNTLSGTEKKTLPVSYLKTTSEKDSDNDGLEDWKEVLWKTDPQEVDTDGDGTSDGDEVKNNRNPLIKAPGDELTKELIAEQNEKATSTPKTLTELIGKQIITDLLIKKTTSDTFTEKDKEDILLSAYSTLESLPEQKNTYQEESIQIIKDIDSEKIKNYGNEFGFIIKKYFNPIKTNEVKIIEEFLSQGSISNPEDLKKIYLAYRNTAQDASKIAVPADLITIHTNILNLFEKISKNLENIINNKEDLILSILEISTYGENGTSARDFLIKINNYFTKNEIVFNEEEDGIVFPQNYK